MVSSKSRGVDIRHLLPLLLLLAVGEAGSGQVRYSVPEEAKHGTFVGRIAQDLGLELEELVPRLFRVASKGHRDLLEVNLQNGILFVKGGAVREESRVQYPPGGDRGPAATGVPCGGGGEGH